MQSDAGGADADLTDADASRAEVDDAPADAADDVMTDGPKTSVSQVPLLHRASAAACTQPRPAGYVPLQCGAEDAGNCSTDQDCAAGSNGRCNCQSFVVTSEDRFACSYDECASDTDCHGGVCDCRESPAHVVWGTQTVCLGGNCKTDSDCGQGGYCSPSPTLGCGAQSWSAYYCHTPGDQCVNDADCNEANAYCAYDASSSRWVCSTGMCVDG